MSNTLNLYEKSLIRDTTSVVAYAPLIFTAGEYIPTVDGETRLFSGLYVAPGTSNGNINIQGVDGNSIVITLSPGHWSFGGAKIIQADTTITAAAVIVLF